MSAAGRRSAWARSATAVGVREVILGGLFAPLLRLHTDRRIVGREVLAGLDGPVLFVATHASHMDTPLLLRALPSAWRRRTAVAAAADYFYRRRLTGAVVSLAFNTVAVQRGDAGAGERTVAELDALIAAGWSLVIFAEGTRTRDGRVGKLHSGAALLAARHGLPLVPVYVSGTHAAMPVGRPWPPLRRRRWPVGVSFAPAVRPRDGEHRTEVMERVRQGLEAVGATTTPDARLRSERRTSARPADPVRPKA